MKKIILILSLMLSFLLTLDAADKISSVHTILVVIEENENGQVLTKQVPATDGILDALWAYEQFIFFDMKITESIKNINNELDASPYAIQAKESGADAILLIKFGYLSKSEGEKVILSNCEVRYKLITLDRLDTVRVGALTPSLNVNILKNEKYNKIKKVGDDVLKTILK